MDRSLPPYQLPPLEDAKRFESDAWRAALGIDRFMELKS